MLLLLLLKWHRHHYKEDALLLFVRLVHTGRASHKQIRSRRSNEDANTPATALRVQVKRLCSENRLKEALKMMEGTGIAIDFDTCASLVQACANSQALAEGKEVHAHMSSAGLNQKLFLRAKLVNMYAICGSMMHAQEVFDDTPKRSVLLWNAMIKGYVKNGFYGEALSLYHQMLRQQKERGRQQQPDNHTFFVFLKHVQSYPLWNRGRLFIITLLKIVHRDAISWNSMIACFTQNCYYDEKLKLFHQMQMQMESGGMEPSMLTMASVLHACAKLAYVRHGKKIHEYIIKRGFRMDVFAVTTLIDMDAKCSCVKVSHQVLTKHPKTMWHCGTQCLQVIPIMVILTNRSVCFFKCNFQVRSQTP